MKQYLTEYLEEYGEEDWYPFHMPGHKRRLGFQGNSLKIDITEIDGFDNLHHAEGILKKTEERIQNWYGGATSHLLVNGSTCGLLAAVSACVPYGKKILIARNCHKAVYHGIYLRQLQVHYVYPCPVAEYGISGGILPDAVKEKLEDEPDIKAVLITSPTYDGVVSDVRSIAKIVHSHGIPLIVDEAHGAHFGKKYGFPESALEQGADVVIHSLHKTLPSFTQTAAIHYQGNLVDGEVLKRFLGIYQSSSPSYVLMASADCCMSVMEKQGAILLEQLKKELKSFRTEMNELRWIRIPGEEMIGENGIWDYDLSKLVLIPLSDDMTGQQLYDLLRERYHLQLEMAQSTYALALTTLADETQGFQRLKMALREIDRGLTRKSAKRKKKEPLAEAFLLENKKCLALYEAMDAVKKEIPLETARGQVSAEFLYLYPPGIPLVVPGEIISGKMIEKIRKYKKQGLEIQGLEDYKTEKIKVITH